MRALSISKPGQDSVNEDFAIANTNLIAVSDGAGGGGIYADKWSEYLVANLPGTPIRAFDELDQWIDGIWESFYNDCEKMAKEAGGMVLNKFYDEGSFATLAAVWDKENKAYWMAYGDSVAFCYSPGTCKLQHSFTSIADFHLPPYLINYKDELKAVGFRSGEFELKDGDIIFCASDALSHYILMMYELSHCSEYADELQKAERSGSKEAAFIKNASSIKIDFYHDVLRKLINCKNNYIFERHLKRIYKDKLIALDDYSFVYKVVQLAHRQNEDGSTCFPRGHSGRNHRSCRLERGIRTIGPGPHTPL